MMVESEVAVALKIVADLLGEKVTEGLLGKLSNWRRRCRLNKLLSRTGYLHSAGLKPVVDGLLGAGEIEIHTFRMICTVARRTGDFNNGRDPVHLDGATISEAVDLSTPDLERVLLMLQARACLSFQRAPVVDARTLNGMTIRVPRSAVEYVHSLSEEARALVK